MRLGRPDRDWDALRMLPQRGGEPMEWVDARWLASADRPDGRFMDSVASKSEGGSPLSRRHGRD